MSPRIGLVVPGLALGGGVPAVARFVRGAILHCGAFELTQVSLSTSSRDPCNVSLAAPRSWLRGPSTTRGMWESTSYIHAGATAGELEFQRYRRRAALSRALANCNLIQVVCGSPAWANAVIGLGKPVSLQVATLARVERQQRDTQPGGAIGLWRKAMTAVTSHLDDRALRRVDAIQVENPWMLDYARQINRGRSIDIRYAPPGIDSHLYTPVAQEHRLRDRYILCVGRLGDPRKRIGLLLEAYVQLPAETRTTTALVLAGSSSPPPSFWQRVEQLGLRDHVRYVANPDADELLGLYQRATVLALPSDEEGFGMVVIEAMACGVPVVATRCGGPDGIITDGTDGFLVPRDDAAATAARLADLLNDDARNAAMGAAARTTIERRYDERIAGAAFIDAWDGLLRKTKGKSCAV